MILNIVYVFSGSFARTIVPILKVGIRTLQKLSQTIPRNVQSMYFCDIINNSWLGVELLSSWGSGLHKDKRAFERRLRLFFFSCDSLIKVCFCIDDVFGLTLINFRF